MWQPDGTPATIKWITVGGRTSAYVAELQKLKRGVASTSTSTVSDTLPLRIRHGRTNPHMTQDQVAEPDESDLTPLSGEDNIRVEKVTRQLKRKVHQTLCKGMPPIHLIHHIPSAQQIRRMRLSDDQFDEQNLERPSRSSEGCNVFIYDILHCSMLPVRIVFDRLHSAALAKLSSNFKRTTKLMSLMQRYARRSTYTSVLVHPMLDL